MKQTAVEWFAQELYEKFEMKGDGKVFDELLDQAKAMEKEQMINSFNQGYTQCSIEDLKPTSRDRYVDAEDYINKTFKSK